MSYKYNTAWRKNHPDRWQKSKKEYYRKRRENATNGWTRWTPDELRMVMDQSITDTQLSKKLGRSVQAIQTKRSKLRSEGRFT